MERGIYVRDKVYVRVLQRTVAVLSEICAHSCGFEISEKPINRFLELGVGQGLSSVIHAATSGGVLR